MKDFFLNKKALYVMNILVVVFSILIGFGINFFTSSSIRNVLIYVLGSLDLLFMMYIAVSYIIMSVLFFKNTHRTTGIIQEYYHNKDFRLRVNTGFTLLFMFSNGLINFGVSFISETYYYYLLSAFIYFNLFLTRLYLVLDFGKNEKTKDRAVFLCLFFTTLCAIGIVVLTYLNASAFTSKGLIIYWDALYAFWTFIAAIVSSVKAVKYKNVYRRRFLSLKLLHATYAMYVLEISMLLTFDKASNYSDVFLWSGIGFSILMLIITFGELGLSIAYFKKNDLEETPEKEEVL